MVLTGFPGAGGGQLILSSTIAVSVSCADTDAAWEFLELLLTADATTVYESLLEENLQDELRELGESYSSDTVLKVEEIVRTASTVTALSSPVPEIVVEEAAAYFAGAFSAEDIAARIQDRVEVWIAEQE